MEKIINTLTWIFSGIAAVLLLVSFFVPEHLITVQIVGFFFLVIAGIVYYGGYAYVENRDKIISHQNNDEDE